MWALWGFIIGSIITMVLGGLAGVVYAEMKFSKTIELWYNECHSKNDVLWTNIEDEDYK
jgi:hypothetical protein